ncbi:MAG: DHH family phosphoesterase [Candidatus Pacearchaeota archaeon]|nr:DHH family phosphoesterase [Candidatus Pacearchaeota archaeon]
MEESFYVKSKEKIESFFNSLNKDDKVGIFAHSNCLDGMVSAIFVSEILRQKNIIPEIINFIPYTMEEIRRIEKAAESGRINKIIVLDINLDSLDSDLVKRIEKINFLFVDHHPSAEDFNWSDKIIKAESADCTSWLIYYLGRDLFDKKDIDWLIDPAMIHEFAFNKKEHFDFLKERNKDITEDNINKVGEFESGVLMIKLSSLINYYKDNQIKAYEIIKNKNLKEIEEKNKIVSEEFDRCIEEYKKNAEYYRDAKVYIGILEPRFDINSAVCTKLSVDDVDNTYVILRDSGDEFFKGSIRDHLGKRDVNKICKNAIKGLKDSVAGGHNAAAGFRIRKEDLKDFKENLRKELTESGKD